MKRREFIRYLAGGTAGLMLSDTVLANLQTLNPIAPVPPNTGANGRVVVVGGGMGGATVAKYLRHWGGKGVKVTLIEPNASYYSCILSNTVIEGKRNIKTLKFDYKTLSRKYGIRHVRKSVSDIDIGAQRVVLSNGKSVAYDRLVISPGIDFETIPGLESKAAQNRIPHAWKAGKQTLALRNQLRRMKKGGTFVITIPGAPYRCPPGPYERACVVADYLQRHKPGSKLMVLDANQDITAGRTNFSNAFFGRYSDVLEYHPSTEVLSINARRRTLDTTMGTLKANVINAIPQQKAGGIILDANLANVDGRWAGVDMQTYESTVAANVHVIGDAAHTTQPKAGHIANAEAKVCADAIVRSLQGQVPLATPVTNSSCYTPITTDTASWLSVVYRYDPASGLMKPTGAGGVEARHATRENYREMLQWFDNLMSDTFA